MSLVQEQEKELIKLRKWKMDMIENLKGLVIEETTCTDTNSNSTMEDILSTMDWAEIPCAETETEKNFDLENFIFQI